MIPLPPEHPYFLSRQLNFLYSKLPSRDRIWVNMLPGINSPQSSGNSLFMGPKLSMPIMFSPLKKSCSQVSGDIVPDKINAPQVERQCCHNPGSVYPQISGNQDSLRIAMPYNMQDSIMGPC